MEVAEEHILRRTRAFRKTEGIGSIVCPNLEQGVSTVNLVCSACLAASRAAESKLDNKPVCGKCKQPLLPAQPIELTQQSFAKFIGRTDVPVLVDFWALWCGPRPDDGAGLRGSRCQAFAPKGPT